MSQRLPIALLKIGGDILLSETQRLGLAANIKTLYQANWQVILLHGGGPQVNALCEAVGLTPNKVAGRRITSEADLRHVIQALAGEVNVSLTSLCINSSLPVLGTNGAANIIQAEKRPPMRVAGQPEPIDFGAVGDVTSINTKLLNTLLDARLIPVVATLGHDAKGRVYNINADTTAVAMAEAMQVDLLVMVTAVGGIYTDLNDKTSLITHIDAAKAEQLIADGVITEGMIPKVQEALKVVSRGVGQVLVTSMADPDNLLHLLRDSESYHNGTRIIA